MSNADIAENPRAITGSNNPPLARSISAEENFSATVTSFLDEEYRELPKTVEALLVEARDLPKEIPDDTIKGRVASLIKRFRDTTARIEAFRVKEGEPYLRGKQAVDQFFFGMQDKCARRDKKAKPGAADVLQQRLTDYDTKVLAAEQERRRRIAEEEARVAREAQERAAREAREAEEARLAAERARKPEIIEQKEAVADQKQVAASEAKVDAGIAVGRAEAAYVDTLAKPADIMRHRGDDGTLSTMATEPYAEVENYDLLDMTKLWPFISTDAKDKALRSWARTTGHSQPMAGAKIGKRPKSVVR
jgi:hypothetical protein